MDFTEVLQPSLNALTGKPGAGKSYFATRCIIQEIMNGSNRPIVTNVPLDRSKLREYTKKDFYVYELETFCDNKHFFQNRGSYHFENIEGQKNIDFSHHLRSDDEGVLYIIDEAHIYFNSRNWKHMSQATLCYITFIRHIGDTLIWMSQKFDDIDKQFRGKTQAFYVLRNLNKERFGWFKRGSGFKMYKYDDEYGVNLHGSTNATPSVTEDYPFEMKIAECYRTSLFNKNHESKYKVKGINLKYIYIGACILLTVFVVWIWNGGLSTIINDMSPSIADTPAPTVDLVKNSLPESDPFASELGVTANIVKVPIYTFGNMQAGDNLQPYEYMDPEQYSRMLKFWLGINRKCKLTFVSDKKTTQNTTGFSFNALWTDFAKLNAVDLTFEQGIWTVQTQYFASFIEYIRNNGFGSNLKEIDLTLKENVPFDLVHGFEIPIESSTASQGVVSSRIEYLETGFSLNLIMETISINELLRIKVTNSDALDLTTKHPVIQKFESSNVIDVRNNFTYQIADFTSISVDISKGFLNSKSLETTLTNKIFISYGDL